MVPAFPLIHELMTPLAAPVYEARTGFRATVGMTTVPEIGTTKMKIPDPPAPPELQYDAPPPPPEPVFAEAASPGPDPGVYPGLVPPFPAPPPPPKPPVLFP